MTPTSRKSLVFAVVTVVVTLGGRWFLSAQSSQTAQTTSSRGDHKDAASPSSIDHLTEHHAQQMIEQGRQIFRYDTFGNETFWGPGHERCRHG